MMKNFIKCGVIGWCAEILFTSLGSLISRDWRLLASTSLWMFPIYGLAAYIPWLYNHIRRLPAFIRGIIYTLCIYVVELVSGLILTFFHVCPWDYSDAFLNYKGIIRLDYAPLWFLLGLFYERFLTNNSIRHFHSSKDCKRDSATEY